MPLSPRRVLTYSQMQAIGPGNAGREYIVTDSGITKWIDDGTLLRPLVQGVLANEPPAAATFSTQANWSTSTLTKTNGLLFINGASASNGTARGLLTTIPSPSACQIQGHATPRNNFAIGTNNPAPSPGIAVVMYEQSTGKLATMGWGIATSYQGPATYIVTSAGVWTSATTRSSNSDYLQWGVIPFMRLRIAGGTVFFEQSWDLQTWDAIFSIATTSAFTTAPSHYGVGTSHFGTVSTISYGHFDHLLLA